MKQVSFMCDEDVYEFIERWGSENDRSFSEAIRHGLRLFFGPQPPSSKIRTGRKPFLAPSLEDVTAYVTEMHYVFDPEAFCAFYESKGWRIGNQPMRDWKAACITWQKRAETSSTFAHAAPNGPAPPAASLRKSGVLGLRRAKDGDGVLYRGDWYHPVDGGKRWHTEDGFRPDGTSRMADAKDAGLNATVYAAMAEAAKS